MNPNGSDPIRLTNNSVIDDPPSVSPDGSKMIFTQAALGTRPDLWVVADGSNAIQVTTGASAQAPDWFPDRTRIVYARQEDGSSVIDLVLIDPDGGNAVTVGSTDPGRTTRR